MCGPRKTPTSTTRHDILRAVKHSLGREARHFNFNAYADDRAMFRYDMHTLPTEISGARASARRRCSAAWNAAVYVAQIDDERLSAALGKRDYLDATQAVLKKHGRLWFQDESYVISKKRE